MITNNKSVGIYLRGDQMIIMARNITTQGIGVTGEPIGSTDTSDPKEIGTLVMKILEQSGKTIPHPIDWSKMANPELKIAGVKSKKSFYSKAYFLFVDQTDMGYSILPTKKENDRGQYQFLRQKEKFFKTSDPEILGRTIVDAFKDCK